MYKNESKIKNAPMHKTTTNYDITADEISIEWMEALEKNGLQSIAYKGVSKNIIRNLLNYSKQLAVLGSAPKIMVSAN